MRSRYHLVVSLDGNASISEAKLANQRRNRRPRRYGAGFAVDHEPDRSGLAGRSTAGVRPW